jgi:hypothetical protein
MTQPKPSLALILFTALAAGCGNEDTEAPTIDMLSLQADTLTVGSQSDIMGSLNFEDPDGDVESLEIELTPPTIAPQTLAVDLTGSDDQTEGLAQFVITVVPPEAGEYEVTVTVIDSAGNRSNALVSALTAE